MRGLQVHFKNVYTTKSNKNILIIYNISAKHFIGIEIVKEKEKNLNYLSSINFYYNIENIKEYKYNDFINALYIKGKTVTIKDAEFKKISKEIKDYYIKTISEKTSKNTIDNLIFDKWMNDKYDLNNNDSGYLDFKFIRPRAIYWINFGYGVGSELRKLRPAILWRHTADKKICTFIPLSTKCHDDIKYFHYDLTCLNNSTTKIECMENLSYKRIVEVYYKEGKPCYINNKDFSEINQRIQNYYVYQKE